MEQNVYADETTAYEECRRRNHREDGDRCWYVRRDPDGEGYLLFQPATASGLETPVQSGPTHTPLARLEAAEQHLNAHGDRDHFTAPDHEIVRAAAELVRTRALAAIAHELAAFNARPRASDEAVQRALAAVGDTSSSLHLAGLETHDKAGSERGDGGPMCGVLTVGGDDLARALRLPCVLPQGHTGAHYA